MMREAPPEADNQPSKTRAREGIQIPVPPDRSEKLAQYHASANSIPAPTAGQAGGDREDWLEVSFRMKTPGGVTNIDERAFFSGLPVGTLVQGLAVRRSGR